jgi:hypothetical protein
MYLVHFAICLLAVHAWLVEQPQNIDMHNKQENFRLDIAELTSAHPDFAAATAAMVHLDAAIKAFDTLALHVRRFVKGWKEWKAAYDTHQLIRFTVEA